MVHKKILFALILMIVLFCLTFVTFAFILPLWNVRNCIQEQRNQIEKIENLIKTAKQTGQEFIEPFTMKACTKCIWFNESLPALEVIFHQEEKPISIPVDMGWGILGKFNDKDHALIGQGFNYRFRITRLGIEDCFNCDVNIGECVI